MQINRIAPSFKGMIVVTDKEGYKKAIVAETIREMDGAPKKSVGPSAYWTNLKLKNGDELILNANIKYVLDAYNKAIGKDGVFHVFNEFEVKKPNPDEWQGE